MRELHIILLVSIVILFNLNFISAVTVGATQTIVGDQIIFQGNLTTFLNLTDTPDSYTGNGSNCVKVNAGETALEFGSCSTGTITNNTAGWILNFTKLFSNDWSNVTITTSQISNHVNNPFNQNLNTTNNVSFVNITLTGNLSVDAIHDLNFLCNTTGSCFSLSELNTSTSSSGDNASWNQSFANTLYIAIINESNLNVNSSNFWDTYNTANATQFENNGGILNLITGSWLFNLIKNTFNFALKNETNVFTANQSINNITNINHLCNASGFCYNLQELNVTVAGIPENGTWNESRANTLYTNQTYADARDVVVNNSALHIGEENRTKLYCNNITGASSDLCSIITGNVSGTSDGQKNTTGFYLYNNTATIFFNETMLNTTIDARADVDTNESIRFNNLTAYDCGVGFLVIGVQANGTVLCATDTTGSATNYFNQQLNTTSNVTFNNLTLTLNLSASEIGYNATQMDNTNGLLSILESWVTTFIETFNFIRNTAVAFTNQTNIFTLNQNVSNITFGIGNNYLCNATGTCFKLEDLNFTDGAGGDNASWNQSFANTLYPKLTDINGTIRTVGIDAGFNQTYNRTYDDYLNNLTTYDCGGTDKVTGVNSTGGVTCGTDQNTAGTNYFNQQLNTTSNATFNNLTLTLNLSASEIGYNATQMDNSNGLLNILQSFIDLFNFITNSNVAFKNQSNTFTHNITVENIFLEVDSTNHRIYDNATCIIINGDTSILEVC